MSKDKLFADAFGIIHKNRRNPYKDHEYTRVPPGSSSKFHDQKMKHHIKTVSKIPSTSEKFSTQQYSNASTSQKCSTLNTEVLSANASPFIPGSKKQEVTVTCPEYGDFSFIPNIAWRALEEMIWNYFAENSDAREYIFIKPKITLEDFKVPAEDWKFNGSLIEKKIYNDLSEYEKRIHETYKIRSTSVSCSIRAVRFILTNNDGWGKYYTYMMTTKK